MQDIAINWWAILAAIVSNFVIGGLWYSPLLFIRPWLEMSGVSKPAFDAGLSKALFGDLIASLIMAFMLAYLLRATGASDLGRGLLITFGIWLGFAAAVLLGSVTYEHRPVKYFAINAGYRFITMMAMGAILTLWK